jgi:hypothetical protein
MTRPPLNLRRVPVIAGLVAVGIVAAALAYWTGAGSGSVSTTLDNPLELTLSAGVPSDPISPGDVASVAVVADNPNPYEIHIASLSLDTGRGTGGFGVDSAHSGCDTSTLGFTTADNGGVGWTVPSRVGGTDGSLPIELNDAISMSNAASNACQGANFTIHLLTAS